MCTRMLLAKCTLVIIWYVEYQQEHVSNSIFIIVQ